MLESNKVIARRTYFGGAIHGMTLDSPAARPDYYSGRNYIRREMDSRRDENLARFVNVTTRIYRRRQRPSFRGRR